MTASGEYQRLEPGSDARGPEVDGTQSTLMRLRATATPASDGNGVAQALSVNHRQQLDFTNQLSNAYMAPAKRTL
jgi:hypothetical protein